MPELEFVAFEEAVDLITPDDRVFSLDWLRAYGASVGSTR
jgi:hypothetical protein